MEIAYTDAERAFRAEVRSWMERHVPATPLPSFDASREGFEAHRAWERTLHAGRWGMVTWPEGYGGRGLDLRFFFRLTTALLLHSCSDRHIDGL